MGWPPGVSGNPAGRPKGARSRATLALREAAERSLQQMQMPATTSALDLLRALCNRADIPIAMRADAAKALLGFERSRFAPSPPPQAGNETLAARMIAAQRRLLAAGQNPASGGDGGDTLRLEDLI